MEASRKLLMQVTLPARRYRVGEGASRRPALLLLGFQRGRRFLQLLLYHLLLRVWLLRAHIVVGSRWFLHLCRSLPLLLGRSLMLLCGLSFNAVLWKQMPVGVGD
jgi:hypothetical protein